jgi:predicted ABC-type ATPase
MATTKEKAPNLVIVAGPNGSGKSTAAPQLLRDYFGVVEFVNADVIAQGLSAFDAESAALDAGRIMIERLDELRTRGSNCAFETTLSGTLDCRVDSELAKRGVPSSPYVSAAAIGGDRSGPSRHEGQRRRSWDPGGSDRRRYQRGLRNLVRLYIPIVDTWKVFDGMSQGTPALIAEGHGRQEKVLDHDAWSQILEAANE